MKKYILVSDAHSSRGERVRLIGGNDSHAVPAGTLCVERVLSSHNVPGVSTATVQSNADPECVQSVPASNLAPPALLQFAKTRKLSIERSDPRKYVSYCVIFFYRSAFCYERILTSPQKDIKIACTCTHVLTFSRR